MDKREYARLWYKKNKARPRKKVLYVLYDLDDNYAYEGDIRTLSKYLGKTIDSLASSICHIKHNRGGRKHVKDKYGKKYTIVKMEE